MSFFKKEAVFCISFIAATITCFFVPPDLQYANYIDFKVLCVLFCLICVVAGFNRQGIFEKAAIFLINRCDCVRTLCAVLVGLCFFMSMLVTNDVALITFVPFTLMTLRLCGCEKYMIYTVVLQTVAANMGSMLTPVGNPQNLLLYYKYNMSLGDFFAVTVPITILSGIILVLFLIPIKKEKINDNVIGNNLTAKADKRFLVCYFLLGILSIMAVFNIFDGLFVVCFCCVILFVTIFDRKVYRSVDLFLIPTFACFFIFAGNIHRIAFIEELIGKFIDGNEFLVSLGLSQIISNVPCAAMVSAFTQNAKALVAGTDIGGLGTLVASLASLISFRIYCSYEKCEKGKYILEFTGINIVFLIILCTFYFMFI